jgi:hypothetical protein
MDADDGGKMNTHEGLNRIAKVFHWIGAGFASLFVLFAVIVPIKGALDNDLSGETVFFIFGFLIVAALCYGIGRAMSWIIEGFAKKSA